MFWRVTAGLLSVLGFPDLLIWHLYLALIGIEVLYMKSSTFELYILFSQYRPHDDYEGTSFDISTSARSCARISFEKTKGTFS